MKSRTADKSADRLALRQSRAKNTDPKQGFHLPGSQNPHKVAAKGNGKKR